MYIPQSFRETDVSVIHDFIESHSFATVVSIVDGLPFASHVPLILDRQSHPQGRLVGHFAKANPHSAVASGSDVLVIFNGPNAYVSPAWYESHSVVPTWNYVAVHAYGKLVFCDDLDTTIQSLKQSVDFYELKRSEPWRLELQDPSFIENLARSISAFEIQVSRIEGKWKLSQNQSVERQARVVNALENLESPNAVELIRLMTEQLANGRPT